jgi:hypothetical protein
MNESEWATHESVRAMLVYLKTTGSRKLRSARLYGCACCRLTWHLLSDGAARTIVEFAEAYLDGKVSEEELRAAGDDANFIDIDQRLWRSTEIGPQISKIAHNLILATRWLAYPHYDFSSAISVSTLTAGSRDDDFYFDSQQHLISSDIYPGDWETAEQAKLIRDIFGNPFRSVTFDQGWRTEHTVGLATMMYDTRIFDAMPVLADALQDAGCDNENILRHCREPGVHVRGCWVVDLVLGKE